MDFLDPKKKKAHVRRLFIGYLLIAIAIGLGALILLFAAFGYGVDRKGNVFQNGLVFMDSTPGDAQVSIKNTDNTFSLQTTTADRRVLRADEYTFEYLKQGYRPWQRTLNLRGGSIERLVYPFLFPENLKTSNDYTYAQKPDLVTQSPNRKVLLAQRAGSLATFDVFESKATTAEPESFSVPSSLFPANAEPKPLKLLEWSTDNRHFLVRYDMGKTPQFILVDRENPEESINVNTVFKQNPSKVTLRDKNAQKFYLLLRDDRLMTGQTNTNELRLISEKVVDFKPHGDSTILYVTTKDAARTDKASVEVRDDDKTYTLRELPVDTAYHLDIARYDDAWFMVAGAESDQNIYIYKDPIKTLESNDPEATMTIRTMKIAKVQKLSFSANSRFIAAQSGQRFVIYDAEDDTQYRYNLGPKLDGDKEATWMDGHRLLASSKGNVLVFDFDGINIQSLNPVTRGTSAYFSDDFTELYTIAPDKKQFTLTRTEMRVEN